MAAIACALLVLCVAHSVVCITPKKADSSGSLQTQLDEGYGRREQQPVGGLRQGQHKIRGAAGTLQHRNITRRSFFAQPMIVTESQGVLSLPDATDHSEGFIGAFDRPPPPRAEAAAALITPLNRTHDGRHQDEGLTAVIEQGGASRSRQFRMAVRSGGILSPGDGLKDDGQGHHVRWVPNAMLPNSPPFLLTARPPTAVRLPSHFRPALYDQFDRDSLNLNKFMYRQPGQLCGRNSYCDPSYVTQENGKLVIKLRYLETPLPYTKSKYTTKADGSRVKVQQTCYAWFSGGGIITRQRYTYGYFETRVKMTKTPGWHEAFWTSYSDGGNNLHPMTYGARSELDVFEHFGSFGPSEFYYGVYRWTGGGGGVPLRLERLTGSRWQPGQQIELTKKYHKFSLLFDRERAAWYLDGSLIHEVRAKKDPSAPDGPYEKIPKNLFHVWLSTITNYRTEGDTTSPPDCYYGSKEGKVVSGEGDVFFDYITIYTID
ncbi:unnamed protein product [Vitrella brassicaformis CCMP3155]|uniref:GH16 domain-containing protein n=1 Tax=Vitrella brassicaformis (strain CCMP3155) TaxID=1169540 RepID=A0A0G4FVT4_VITBC|nr:unnamed protein product [Vitrella brassicaformis CCMP3155]|eukprot:CEM19283.1 unnamed protein product [Vitrella brassicaformis CCMP3155]